MTNLLVTNPLSVATTTAGMKTLATRYATCRGTVGTTACT